MRIGINGILLAGPRSGATRRIECLARELLRLGHEVVLYASARKPPAIPAAPNLRVVPLPVPPYPAIPRATAERIHLPHRVLEDHLDVLECSHFPVPPVEGPPLLVTIHDLRHLSLSRLAPFTRRFLARRVYGAAFERAARIVAVSEFTKAEILRHFPGIRPDKVAVVPNAADHLEPPSPPPPRKRVILYTGHLERRKNLATLLRAFALFKAKAFPHRLRLAGAPKGSHGGELAALAMELGVSESVEWLGAFGETDLPGLYASAEIFALPSRYEGFGITLLEAMRCGTPVLAARSSALPEVGGDACLYADPESPEAWAAGLERIARDEGLRASLAKKGLENEHRFRWKRSSELLLRCLV